MNYEFGLQRDGAIIDRTGLDEDDAAFAAELFYIEFGYEPDPRDRIVLLSVTEDDA
jgi:hypothetical protein